MLQAWFSSASSCRASSIRCTHCHWSFIERPRDHRRIATRRSISCAATRWSPPMRIARCAHEHWAQPQTMIIASFRSTFVLPFPVYPKWSKLADNFVVVIALYQCDRIKQCDILTVNQTVTIHGLIIVVSFQDRTLCLQWVQNLPWPWQNHGQSWRKGMLLYIHTIDWDSIPYSSIKRLESSQLITYQQLWGFFSLRFQSASKCQKHISTSDLTSKIEYFSIFSRTLSSTQNVRLLISWDATPGRSHGPCFTGMSFIFINFGDEITLSEAQDCCLDALNQFLQIR